MKKHLLIYLLLIFVAARSFSTPIDEATAMKIGLNFLKTRTQSEILKNVSSLELAYKAVGEVGVSYYVFNTNVGGFIMISADDIVLPILGYSDKGKFEAENIPRDIFSFFDDYKLQIQYAVVNKLQPTDEIKASWNSLRNGTPEISAKANNGILKNINKSIYSTINNTSETAVSPMIKTRWGQGEFYNEKCPYDYNKRKLTYTGCVATAMAQVLNYWKYPEKGFGSSRYNSVYGVLNAEYYKTTYDWNSMPKDTAYKSNNALATLMYHCGVSVEMNYGPDGSGADVLISDNSNASAENALKTYFGYSGNLKGIKKGNDTDWKNILTSEIDLGRPIIYAGFSNDTSGHCFIIDGYKPNFFFHVNWGWNGNLDGDFYLNNLNPSIFYKNNNHAIIGIEPPKNLPSYDLKLYAKITVTPTPVTYASAFKINTNIGNFGTTNFNGKYCAAIFDEQYNYVDTLPNINSTLNANNYYTNGLEFKTSGMSSLVPGKYYVGIFYAPTNGGWTQVSDYGDFKNLVEFNVVSNSILQLYSSIVPTPSTFTQGQSATVTFNLINTSKSTFTGDYTVALFDLDGNFVENFDIYTESKGLPTQYRYNSPRVFTKSSIEANSGTYYLAAFYKAKGESTWTMIGADNYPNPIKITVQSLPINPDKYEVNNSFEQAYSLPVNFSGKIASVNTQGSNFHLSNDKDYYKVSLPTGSSYSISSRLHDLKNASNGNKYTTDAFFSYSIDGGVTWTSSFDDTLSNKINFNGGNLYFLVSTNFVGQLGTYLLDISINISPCQTAAITLEGNTNSCSNVLVTLKSNSETGNQWYLNNSPINGSTGNNHLTNVSGSYTLVTTVNGCVSNPSMPVVLTVNPTPEKPSILWNGTQLTAPVLPGGIYKWYLENKEIQGASESIFRPSSTGNYNVKVVQNNCESLYSDNYFFLVTGITSYSNGEYIKVYPNPTSSRINIDFEIQSNASLNLSLYDATGKEIYHKKNIKRNDSIDLSKNTSGAYFIALKDKYGKIIYSSSIIKN